MTIRGPYEYPKYYIGLSTDTKPPANIGDEFFETDTKKTYICYDGTNWSEKIGAIASDVTEIQSDVKSVISDLVDVVSDLADIMSDTTEIQSDVKSVISDLADIISDLTETNSDVKSIISDLVDITSDLNDIRSDIVTVQSDIAEVHSDVRSIISDIVDVVSDLADIMSDTTEIQSDVKSIISDLADIASDLIITQTDAQIRTISGGSKTLATGTTKYFSFDSATNGAEIISIIVKGIIGAAWTLDIYVPTDDAVAAPAAGDKRDTIVYLSTDTEGGLLQGFGIIFNGFLNFTNNGAGNQTITDIVMVYRSRAAISVAWEA